MAARAPWLVPSVWAGGLLPIVVLAVRWSRDELGANPVDTVLNQLGLLALVTLLACLACTPAQLVFKWAWPLRVRQHLGLLGFGYVTVHLALYLLVDQGARVSAVLDDIGKRPFVTVGFVAWVLLVPLALTSNVASVRWLGFPRWKRLHRLVYVIGVLGVVHFIWRAKKDVTEPAIYAAVLAMLFFVRLVNAAQRRVR